VLALPDAWLVATTSGALRARPLAVEVLGRPLVLFRGKTGAPVALTDRCPHRNAPLSLGAVRGGELACAYHGWRFDDAGACVGVPGLVDGPVSLRSRCAERWATREAQGYVWVYTTPAVEPATLPFSLPHLDHPGYATVRRVYEVEAPLQPVVENILDVPHTAFLHGGLFRTARKANVVEVVVRRHDTWAEAEFVGEPAPRGLLARLLAPRGGVVEHTDRFFLPAVAQVEYRLGQSHLVSTSLLTPVSEVLTRLHAVVTFTLPLPAWLVTPFVAPVAGRIFAQDAAMLRRQTATVQRLGERFTSTELDVLGPLVARLLQQAAAGAAPPAGSHEHRIRLQT
jgi:phenylpropionate dioxygenase-like ring-hydroxylating dioxygenase large terminal subunit